MNNIPHSDGLYPDWDEFYLAVCDICDMIIKPQALEKHLASKHGINVLKSLPLQNGHHQNNATPTNNHNNHHHHLHHHPFTNHNHTGQQNSKSKLSAGLAPQPDPASQAPDQVNSSNNIAVPNPNIADLSANNSHNTAATTVNGHTDATQQQTTSNDATEHTNSATATAAPKCWGGKQSLDSSPKPANSRQPCYLMRMRYRGTKWRNTYDVLRDVLF